MGDSRTYLFGFLFRKGRTMNTLFFCYSATTKWWAVFCGDCLSAIVNDPLAFLDEEGPDKLWVHRYTGQPNNHTAEHLCERCEMGKTGESFITLQERFGNALHN